MVWTIVLRALPLFYISLPFTHTHIECPKKSREHLYAYTFATWLQCGWNIMAFSNNRYTYIEQLPFKYNAIQINVCYIPAAYIMTVHIHCITRTICVCHFFLFIICIVFRSSINSIAIIDRDVITFEWKGRWWPKNCGPSLRLQWLRQ